MVELGRLLGELPLHTAGESCLDVLAVALRPVERVQDAAVTQDQHRQRHDRDDHKQRHGGTGADLGGTGRAQQHPAGDNWHRDEAELPARRAPADLA
jgi:hypothetical protein